MENGNTYLIRTNDGGCKALALDLAMAEILKLIDANSTFPFILQSQT